jgi:uncharacterized membrane protein
MNSLAQADNIGSGIASLTFFAALVLTLWPRRAMTIAAAILFSIGTWVSLGILAHHYFIIGTIAYGMTDSGPNTIASLWFLLPIMAIVYALMAPVLLWPSIPQATAMRFGTILNLTLIPLLAVLLFARTYISTQGFILPDVLKWLVYALLWFRIRQNYEGEHKPKTPT